MTENRHLRTKNCSLREGEAQLPSSSNDGVSSQVSKGGVKFYEATKPRFNGHHTVYDRWFRFFEPINIRLYHGGFFVAKKKADTYEGGGMGLYLGVGELCFLQLVRWIVNDLKYSDEGDIWFRKRGKSLKYGRSRIVSDDDIPNFLNAPEKDGFYHLYVIHIRRRVEVRGEGESNATVARNECWDDLESSQFNSAMGGPFEGSGEFNSVDGATPKILSHVDTTTLVDHTTNLTPQPNTQSLIQPRKKLATFSSQKQQPNTQSSNTNVPITEVEEGGEEELEPIWSEDEGGSDVILSEDDYEDQDDDDLFHQFVNHEITEGVSRALGGLTQQGVTGVGEGSSAGQQDDEDQGGEDEGGGADLEDDGEDLVDSDDEKVSIVGSDDEGDAYAKFNPETDFKGAVELSQGLVFPSAKIFRKALQWNAIDKGYNYYFLHNNKKRISVYCAKRCDCKWRKGRIVKCECKKKRKCRFKVHCRKLKFEQSWQIKSYRPTHVCGRQIHNPKLTSKYLAERYLEDFRGDPSMKLKAFIERARRECKCEIGYYKAWHAKRLALEMLFGTAKGEYEKVWDYANAIRENLPGSTAIVKCTGMDKPPAMFERMYICLQPCKEGFIAGCRPIIGVDGAHLRGPFPGILLTAVGKDGNNNIFPVAWAVVEVENTETWTWFLALLRNDLASVADSVTWVHEDDEVTYMSDRQKGLIEAFKSVMPNAETRYCCRHIWSNFKDKFSGEVFRQHFWKAARATAKHHFNQEMEKIKGIDKEAYNWLAKIPTRHWARHAFSSSCKSGMVLNNCCESFNSVLREAREKPILQLMEWIRRYVMGRCNAKREGLQNYNGVIMPSVVKMIEKAFEETYKMRIHQADLLEFEVDHDNDTFVVNLERSECTCYRWTLLGTPCWHALACIQKLDYNWEDFVHKAYHISSYAATYGPAFRGMPGHEQWEATDYPKPLPPPYRVMPGRPSKKKRKKGRGEDQERQQVKRAKKQNKCSRCGGLGHYKTSCKATLPSNNHNSAAPSSAQASQQVSTLEISCSAPNLE